MTTEVKLAGRLPGSIENMQAAEARTGNTPLPFDETDPNPVTVLDDESDGDN